jgi:hypothetical protein
MTTKPFARPTEYREYLYRALLSLNFRDQLSWHFVKNNKGGSLYLLHTQDGSREAIIISQGQLDGFWDIVDKARHSLAGDGSHGLWDRKERKAEEPKPQSMQEDGSEPKRRSAFHFLLSL